MACRPLGYLPQPCWGSLFKKRKYTVVPVRLTLPQQKAFNWQPMGYSMRPSKHAVHTNPIQAAECIEGICSKPLSEVNEAFILLMSLLRPPKDLDWPFRDSGL